MCLVQSTLGPCIASKVRQINVHAKLFGNSSLIFYTLFIFLVTIVFRTCLVDIITYRISFTIASALTSRVASIHRASVSRASFPTTITFITFIYTTPAFTSGFSVIIVVAGTLQIYLLSLLYPGANTNCFLFFYNLLSTNLCKSFYVFFTFFIITIFKSFMCFAIFLNVFI